MTTSRRDAAALVNVTAERRLDLTTFPAPPAWTLEALCPQVGSEIFFPAKGGSTREAKAVCARCPVQRQCLAYADEVETDEAGLHGIWGGESPRQRAKRRHAEHGTAA